MGSDIETEWYFLCGSEKIGPVSLSEIQSLISQATVTSRTLVWNEEMTEWATADQSPLKPSLDAHEAEAPAKTMTPPPLPPDPAAATTGDPIGETARETVTGDDEAAFARLFGAAPAADASGIKVAAPSASRDGNAKGRVAFKPARTGSASPSGAGARAEVGWGAAINEGFSGLDDFSGRCSRNVFWQYFVVVLGILVALSLATGGSIPQILFSVALGLLVAAGTRRMRDAGWSPWLMLLAPIVPPFAMILWAYPSVPPKRV